MSRESVIEKIISSVSPEGDAGFMQAALSLARAAASFGEVPVGCVIVKDCKIIAADFNGREEMHDATYHAELSAIRTASKSLGSWRLDGCTLYVTLEPCPMCAGAIWASRISRVVIGATDPRAGSFGSVLNLNSYPLNHKPDLTFGILENECREELQNFFAARRRF